MQKNSAPTRQQVIDLVDCPKCKAPSGTVCKEEGAYIKASHTERVNKFKIDFSGSWTNMDLTQAAREAQKNKRLINSGTTFRSQYRGY